MTCLVDTNILIYAYDPTEDEKNKLAIEILSQLEAASIGALSAQVLNEFYYNVTLKIDDPLDPGAAQLSVRRFIEYWPVFPVTADVVQEGIRGAIEYRLSYWDSLIWAVANMNSIPYILTEDFSHRQRIEDVTIINPFAGDFSLESMDV